MTQEKEKRASLKSGKHEIDDCAEMPGEVQRREKNKLGSCSASLKLNSAAMDQTGEYGDEEQPDHELPALFSLTVQRYEGETSEGQFHGEGVACFEGGHVYKGTFSFGLMDGPGVFTWADRLKYEGEFVCNMPMGLGMYTWPDGSSYIGDVYNGVRQGNGTYKSAKNGVSYCGQWHQSKMHGKGAVYYNQDKMPWYKGDWVRNNREGWGVRRYHSGNTYSGEWKNNVRHGEGTMRWLKLGQQYTGKWQDGVQHGRGTHVWNLGRMGGSLYCQINRYTGDFVRGQRHGQGSFCYAGGAVYEGGWKNNKKHGKGKFTFKDGQVCEGEFVDDQMITPSLRGSNPHCGLPISGKDAPLADMALNIQCLLEKIPERRRDLERQQVEFVVLRHIKELKSVYSFYRRLGHAQAPDCTFVLSRMQLWRMLKDCNIHHHGITLAQLDLYIREDTSSAEAHSPFTPVLLHRLLSFLVVVAYHIYHKDMVSQKHLLAACFSKLLTEDIFPNATTVKGFLFKQPERAVVAVNYFMKCWEIYQAYCRVIGGSGEDCTITYLHLLWMFQDLHLDNSLTTLRLLEVITAESSDSSNPSSCLELEITFLEFFEVLLGCAAVKCEKVSNDYDESQSPSSPEGEARGDSPGEEASGKPVPTKNSPLLTAVRSTDTPELTSGQDPESQPNLKDTSSVKFQSAEHTGGEMGSMQIREMQSEDQDVGIQMIHHFFNHIFFPAFDHYQLMISKMKEETQHSG